MTGGLAYEGLNNNQTLKSALKKFIVVLNDNEMSISKNVGGIARHLNRIISGKLYNQFKEQVERVIRMVPHVGDSLVRLSRRMQEYIKGMISPGILFEEFGFRYFGPVDGHNIEDMISIFRDSADLEGPFLVHLSRRKEKGYKPAEMTRRPSWLGPFDKDTDIEASQVQPYAFSEEPFRLQKRK